MTDIRNLHEDPEWEHLENIACCVKVKDGLCYHDAESMAAANRLTAIRQQYGESNVQTGNGVPIAPNRIGVYVRVSS